MKKTIRIWIATFTVFCLAVGTLTAQSRCEERMTMELDMPTSGIQLLEVSAGAGSLDIEGDPGRRDIRVEAELCASSADQMQGLDVTLERSGSTAVLETVFPERRGGWGRGYAMIHLTVLVPAGMDASVSDGSGEARIRGVGALDMDDGSGELTITDVGGTVVVDDGSGELHIENVDGSVEVEDGSGELTISGVTGSVWLDDGSGRARIESVGGDVEVVDKGSGQIFVRDVDGDLSVEGTRRERIRYEDVRGSLDLPPARRRGRRGG